MKCWQLAGLLTCAAVVAPTATAKELPGFKLDGERWTYKDDAVTMEGILLKPQGDGPFPAILISHGKGGSAQGFGLPKAKEMARWGFVCIAPNYTHAGKDGVKGSDGASDENLRRAARCLDILESFPSVDKMRLAAYGHSMGGFVTIGLAGTAPDRLRAIGITGSGISPKAGFPAPPPELAGKVRAPCLILHGSKDSTVRPEQSQQLKDLLDKNKVAAERVVFDGEGHPIDQTKREEVYKLLQDWYTKHGVLKK